MRVKKTRRLASRLAKTEAQPYLYTVFLKFPATSNSLLAGNLYFPTVVQKAGGIALGLTIGCIRNQSYQDPAPHDDFDSKHRFGPYPLQLIQNQK